MSNTVFIKDMTLAGNWWDDYEGEEMEFAYIITSLMKNSPNAPLI